MLSSPWRRYADHQVAPLGRSLTQVACPWRNGRIERFFGTFKEAIERIVVVDNELAHRLIEFRAFYNHARTHQHFGGRTPAEAWNCVAKAHIESEFIELWGGALAGWHFPMRE
ncbi:MAG: transposase [Rhodanobacteraceae bacterium]|nr:transposase [Rhodanobacteraceae bacterium]MBK7043015.1 transposase [Rhodanobacteraceae bacterium]